jgi:peptidoglycan-associated lipoprotein
MRAKTILLYVNFIALALVSTGCRRSSGEVLEDTRSAGRHMGRGMRAMGGKHGDSRQIQSTEDFYGPGEICESDFIPMNDGNRPVVNQMAVQQPRETPGERGGSVPGIDSFRDPATISGLAGIFKTIYFEYNSNLVKGQESLDTVHDVADYLRKHDNTYLFVEGHADERGPDAFNLALGARRSNSVRSLLIKEGVNPDRVFTISYGKERPIVFGHDEECWHQNRRVEFKVYQR